MGRILLRTAGEADFLAQWMTASNETILLSGVASSRDSDGCTMQLPRGCLAICALWVIRSSPCADIRGVEERGHVFYETLSPFVSVFFFVLFCVASSILVLGGCILCVGLFVLFPWCCV